MGPTVMDLGRPRSTAAYRGVRSRTWRLVAAVGATVGVFGLSPAASPSFAAVGNCVIGSGWTSTATFVPAYEGGVLDLVNQERAKIGLGALSVSPTLSASAEWKAAHMATFGYMTHDDPAPPVARTWTDRVAACGYTSPAGENIAYGQATPFNVMYDPIGWMSSPIHRAAIQNSLFTVTGIGAASAPVNGKPSPNGVMYWAEDFGIAADAPAFSAVTLRNFSGSARKHGVLVRWRTASEIDTAGFRLYREAKGKRVRINPKMIPSGSANGRSASGHRYSFLDRHAPKGKRVVRYWLQSLDLDATKNWYGPALVRR